MFKFSFVLNALTVVGICAGDLGNLEDLPSWIKDSPGFKNPAQVDSIKAGNGCINSSENGSRSWIVFLNEKTGHGIEMQLEKLNLNPDLNDFLLVSSWPLTGFRQIKLFTGKHTKPVKKLRIPNTKTLYVLFSASPSSSQPGMALNYRRYGASLETPPPPTDNPVKKETIYEVQLKGKSPDEFSVAEFLKKVKEGLRASARRYCAAHSIPFNENITTEEMVSIHRISFCPFEWPERSICASVEHSIFVSGVSLPGEEFILNYQLTADHLKIMWSEDDFQELRDLEITVFRLPGTSNTILYWSLIIALMIVSSLIGTLIFWKANHVVENSARRTSTSPFEVRKTKKPKLRLAKHQQVPSFMYKSAMDAQMESVLRAAGEEVRPERAPEVVSKPGDSSRLPIGNYLGSILFGSNKAFEEEEESPIELRANPEPK